MTLDNQNSNDQQYTILNRTLDVAV